MTSLEKLQSLLRDLFQIDRAELDFGIYRLFRLQRDEIEAFLQHQLPRTVDQAFSARESARKDHLDQELGEARADLEAEFPDQDVVLEDGALAEELREAKGRSIQELVTRYEKVRKSLADVEVSEEHVATVFNHLHAFFSRYYDDGDFIPRRHYGSRARYAVPYDGEETHFHWANRGQHYVKSAELLRDFAFTVEGDLVTEPRRVRFVLTEATTPPGDTKGDARYFFPQPEDMTWDDEGGVLTIPFQYRRPTAKEADRYGRKTQDEVIEESLPLLFAEIGDGDLRTALERPDSEEGDARSSLERQLRRFVRRQTSDYFVHRDLGGFLERELEFYLKDQALHLADLDGEMEACLRTLRVLRDVAQDVIRFLAGIEDLQKRLFEKRKFVLRTDYMVLLDAIPQELWSNVIANEAQLARWQELFKVCRDEVVDSAGNPNLDFLTEHPTLVVDTELFDDDFRDRVLATFDDLDDAIGGVLIHSENYQALRLIQPKYAGRVKCVYIDPPYNTGSDDFIYKDRYQHSSWLAMMEERLRLARPLMRDDGVIFTSIDDTEHAQLRGLFDRLVGESHLLGNIVWQKRYSRDNRPAMGTVHDYIVAYCVDLEQFGLVRNRVTPNEDSLKVYRNPNNDPRGRWRPIPMTAQGHRPNQMYEITTPAGVVHTPPAGRCWSMVESEFQKLLDEGRIWFGADEKGQPNVIRYLDEVEGFVPWTWWPHEEVGHTDEAKKEIYRLLGKGVPFDTPKPVRLLDRILHIATQENEVVMDFFAGSGTTGHSAIEKASGGEGSRYFVLVEQGAYFDSILAPRIAKVMYSGDWEDGKPSSFRDKGEAGFLSPLVKLLRLESYEDSLHNLTTDETLERTAPRAKAHRRTVGDDAYRLRYLACLPLESSASMLSVEKLEHPFSYTLEVLTDDGPMVRTVDLVETFNLAYGLHVARMEWWRNQEDDHEEGGRRYRAIVGRDREYRRTLVLWRDAEQVDAATERGFLEARLAEAELMFDKVLINGDTATPGVDSLDPVFKRLIEEEER